MSWKGGHRNEFGRSIHETITTSQKEPTISMYCVWTIFQGRVDRQTREMKRGEEKETRRGN